MNLIVKCEVMFYRDFSLKMGTNQEMVLFQKGDVLLDVHESFKELISDNTEVFEVYDG